MSGHKAGVMSEKERGTRGRGIARRRDVHRERRLMSKQAEHHKKLLRKAQYSI